MTTFICVLLLFFLLNIPLSAALLQYCKYTTNTFIKFIFVLFFIGIQYLAFTVFSEAYLKYVH